MANFSNHQRYLFWLGGVAGLMALAMAVLMVYQGNQRQAIEESVSQRVDSTTALTFHLEREFLRLSQAMEHYVSRAGDADRDALQLRYDIFLSRLSLLRENPSTRGLVDTPEYQAIIPRLNGVVRDADRVFNQPTLDRGALQGLLETLNSLHPDVLALTTAAIKREVALFNTQAEKMLYQSGLIMWLMAGQLGLLLATAIALTIRQFRQDAERRAAEALNDELRRQRQKADQANQAKSQFLANMSHELRTPFNGILGMLKLLQSTGLSGTQADYVIKTERVAASLLSLINDILDFSKVEAGKITIENHPFRMETLLRDVSLVLSTNVGTKPVELIYDIDPTLPEVVVGDSTRLRQVLLNLGSNAIKFTDQGQVLIRLEPAAPQGLPSGLPGTAVRLSVTDTGIGIAPENQSLIFAGFEQAEASITRRFGGTGLGLAISKRLVELMGGQLALRSALGQGSEFSFAIELPVPAEIPQELQLAAPGPDRPQDVLIVDDHPTSRAVLSRLVRAWNWSATEAASGDEALACVQRRKDAGLAPFDVIYIDWTMPAMDGWALAQALRAMPRPRRFQMPRLVMMAGQGREELLQRTPQEQALLDGFLIKPISPGMLREAALRKPESRAALQALAAAQRNAGRVRRLQGLRILVVEDNPLNQQVAEKLLAMEGAQVQLADNGERGVAAIVTADPPFDMVLMDLQMPIMDGYAAHRHIRDVLGLTELPVVAMTANAMTSDREKCLREGMDEHVGKPFDLNRLVDIIHRLTGRGETAASAAPGSPDPA